MKVIRYGKICTTMYRSLFCGRCKTMMVKHTLDLPEFIELLKTLGWQKESGYGWVCSVCKDNQ